MNHKKFRKLILEDLLSDFDGGLSTNTVGGEKESRTKKEQES